MLTLHF